MNDFCEQLKSLSQIIYFDQNDYLREKVNNKHALQALIDDAEQVLKHTDNKEEQYFLMGTLGNLFRVKEEPKQAIQYLNQALNLATPDSTQEIVTFIRLGEAYKYANQHEQALELFEYALIRCHNSESNYLDFALQHKGKCLMEMGRLSTAMEAFQGALIIRKDKGDESLVDSTKQAIDYLKKLGEVHE